MTVYRQLVHVGLLLIMPYVGIAHGESIISEGKDPVLLRLGDW